MPNSQDEWVPTSNQNKVLALAIESDFQGKASDYCVQAGIDRTSFYQWCKTEGFLDWWSAEADKNAAGKLPAIKNAIALAAMDKQGRQDAKHNPAAQRLALELLDPNFKSKAEVQHGLIEGIPDFLKILHGESDETDDPPA